MLCVVSECSINDDFLVVLCTFSWTVFRFLFLFVCLFLLQRCTQVIIFIYWYTHTFRVNRYLKKSNITLERVHLLIFFKISFFKSTECRQADLHLFSFFKNFPLSSSLSIYESRNFSNFPFSELVSFLSLMHIQIPL